MSPQKITYIGVDESSLSIGNGGLIVVGAQTTNPALARDVGYARLPKAKDYLEAARRAGRPICFPPWHEMVSAGVETFHWMRANWGGRFRRQQIEHASIAHIITANGYKPESTVLLIDSFHTRPQYTIDLLKEYCDRMGFALPKGNIECFDGGDRSVPIINYADIIAFQIGLSINKRYRRFFPDATQFPISPLEIPFQEQRVPTHLSEHARKTLELVLNPPVEDEVAIEQSKAA